MEASTNIMIVEDEAIVSLEIEERLKSCGYNVVASVASGEQAIETAMLLRPNLILMDIRLEGPIDGIKAAEIINDKSKFALPIIFLTAYSDQQTLEQAGATRPYGYLLKPFKEQELHATIQMALRKFEMDQVLATNEENFRLFFENAPVYGYMVSLDGYITDVNSTALLALNYSKEMLVGKPLRTLYAPDSSSYIEKELRDLRNGQVITNKEMEIVTGNNTKRIVFQNANLVKALDGSQLFILFLQEDITKSKHMEEELVRQEEWFRGIFEESPIAINVFDKNGEMVLANRACLDMFGVKETSDLQGLNLFSDPNTADWVKERIKKDEQVRYESAFDFSKVRRDGLYETEKQGIMWLDAVLSPLRYGDARELQGYIVQMQDITSQKQAEEELLSTIELMKKTFESQMDAVFIFDPSNPSKIIDANPASTKMFGYDKQELIGRTSEFLHVSDKAYDDFVRQLRNSLDTAGFLQLAPFNMKRKDGSVFPTELTVAPLIGEQDRLDGFVSVVRDITSQKQAEEELRRSEKKYSQLFHSTKDAILIRSIDGKMLDVNQSAVDLFGFSRAEFFSMKLTKIASKDTIRQIVEAIDKQGWNKTEAPLRKKSGEIFIADVSSNLVEIDKQKVIQTIVADITERKQAEEILKQSEENFRILAESSLQGISIYQKGLIVYSNQAYADIIGYTIDEILAFEPERIWQLIHPDDVEMLKEVYSKFLEENETSNNLEFRIIHKNGSCRWVGSYFAVTNYNGEQAIQIIQIDNTQRKEAEKKVEDSRNRAEFFLDLMSHDLSNIHQAVYGIFDLLLIDTNLTNNARELIQEGLYQIIRSNRLIKSVQKFKEIEDAPPELIPTDPFDAISAALENVQRDMPYKRLNLKTKNKAGMYKVMADEYLTDVFYAIFHNAMRFDPNSQVDVELNIGMTKDKSKIRIRMSDHGTGIPNQTKNLLFGRVSLLRTGYLGTGIGLTLLNRIISHYGGTVYVEDRVPEDYRQGVKFILEIPRASPDSV
jgi:PAS domain S-box-containing protein